MRISILALFLTLTSQQASAACSSSLMNMYLDDAKTALRRISSASDLDEAQSQARRLKSAADSLEIEVMSCNCWMAQSEFSDASSRARRAQNADDVDDFNSHIKRAARAISDGVDAFNSCQSSK